MRCTSRHQRHERILHLVRFCQDRSHLDKVRQPAEEPPTARSHSSSTSPDTNHFLVYAMDFIVCGTSLHKRIAFSFYETKHPQQIQRDKQIGQKDTNNISNTPTFTGSCNEATVTAFSITLDFYRYTQK